MSVQPHRLLVSIWDDPIEWRKIGHAQSVVGNRPMWTDIYLHHWPLFDTYFLSWIKLCVSFLPLFALFPWEVEGIDCFWDVVAQEVCKEGGVCSQQAGTCDTTCGDLYNPAYKRKLSCVNNVWTYNKVTCVPLTPTDFTYSQTDMMFEVNKQMTEILATCKCAECEYKARWRWYW